jgi:hypothetical protein
MDDLINGIVARVAVHYPDGLSITKLGIDTPLLSYLLPFLTPYPLSLVDGKLVASLAQTVKQVSL